MQNNKKIVIAGVIATTLAGATANYIYDINKELTSTKEQIVKLEDVNTRQKEEIDRLNDTVLDKNINISALKGTNTQLTEEVEKLKKELKEKVLPTQRVTGAGTAVQITMTFYGDFAHENGGYAGIDANGNKLVAGTVASNYYPQGTKFEFRGQVYTVRDRGGSNFNSPNRLDVFVPRLKNESDSAYSKRIREYGVKKVTMLKR